MTHIYERKNNESKLVTFWNFLTLKGIPGSVPTAWDLMYEY